MITRDWIDEEIEASEGTRGEVFQLPREQNRITEAMQAWIAQARTGDRTAVVIARVLSALDLFATSAKVEGVAELEAAAIAFLEANSARDSFVNEGPRAKTKQETYLPILASFERVIRTAEEGRERQCASAFVLWMQRRPGYLPRMMGRSDRELLADLSDALFAAPVAGNADIEEQAVKWLRVCLRVAGLAESDVQGSTKFLDYKPKESKKKPAQKKTPAVKKPRR